MRRILNRKAIDEKHFDQGESNQEFPEVAQTYSKYFAQKKLLMDINESHHHMIYWKYL